MPFGKEVGLSPGQIVLDGDPAPFPLQKFLADVCCGHMVGWIKMPLGTEEGISRGHIV